MRVLQLGMSPTYGGTESIVYGIQEHLLSFGVIFDYVNAHSLPLAKESSLEKWGSRVFTLDLRRRGGLFRLRRRIIAFWRSHYGEYDAFVCNVQSADQIDMLRYSKKYGGVKTNIIHLHNSGFGSRPSLLGLGMIIWNKRRLHKFCDKFIACAESAARWGFSKRDAMRSVILKNGINPDTFCFSDSKRRGFRQRFSIEDDTVLFGSIGRMDPQKNQVFLLKIFKEILPLFPSARFVLVGKGDLRNQLLQEAKSLNIENQLLVFDFWEDSQEIYSAMDCFLLPSQFEGLGMVLIEAQCCGLPCVATKGSIPECVCFSPYFVFKNLADGPCRWAEVAVNLSALSIQREAGARLLREAGRTIEQCAAQYWGILRD